MGATDDSDAKGLIDDRGVLVAKGDIGEIEALCSKGEIGEIGLYCGDPAVRTTMARLTMNCNERYIFISKRKKG